jgi:hypothetical protein
MLLARRQPASGFRKRLPAASAEAPKARGFGPRQKIVAAPRKGLRIATAGGMAASSLSESAAVPDWTSDIDWLGDSVRVLAASAANGHASEGIADLPPPEAIPQMSPEVRTLN